MNMAMEAGGQSKAHSGRHNGQTLAQILESAVVSWADLMRGAAAGLIPIEYGFAPGGTLDSLKVWSSVSRGRSPLICEYFAEPIIAEPIIPKPVIAETALVEPALA